jgi:hypothetical protein
MAVRQARHDEPHEKEAVRRAHRDKTRMQEQGRKNEARRA